MSVVDSTKCMEQSCSWEADIRLAGQEIPLVFVFRRVHHSPAS
jgi:hypothetical protein